MRRIWKIFREVVVLLFGRLEEAAKKVDLQINEGNIEYMAMEIRECILL